MSKLAVTDIFIYRWRYHIAYLFLALLLAGMLYLTGMFAPGGISETEMRSVVRTSALNSGVLFGQQPEQLIYLPYRALQVISLNTFGISAFSLKLPSLLLAGLAALLFYSVIKLWFKRNIAIISTVILATTEQFLLQSQQATPLVSYLFWGVLILLAASMMAQAKRLRPLWLILTATAAGLAIYSPYMIYIVVALAVTALIHPHARFIVFRQPLWAKLAAGVVFIIVSVPLIWTIAISPQVSFDLLGVPTENWRELFMLAGDRSIAYINFANPSNASFIAPAYGLGTILLALLGLYRLFSAKYTAKSYILTIWLAFTVAVIVFNPQSIGFTLLPIMLLVTFGINYLLRSWYRLFPLNPYARFVGLVPLSILIIGLSFSSIERFTYGYHYNSSTAITYRNDLSLLNSVVSETKDRQITLVVSEKEQAFYEVYARYSSNPTINITSDNITPKAGSVLIIGPEAKRPDSMIPSRVVTSGVSDQPNRFYIYEAKQ